MATEVAGWLETCTDGSFQVVAVAGGDPTISSVLPAGQTINEDVTITGTNLGSTSGFVTIGGYICVIHSWADTSISARIPQQVSAGSNTVVVVTSGNKAASETYTVDTPAGQTTSIRTKIRDAIQWGLTQITTTNGYNYTVTNAYDPPRSLENMSDFPCINIHYGNETATNSQVGSHLVAGNESLLHNTFSCEFDCVLSDIDDPQLAQDKILADLQKYFGTKHWVPDSDGAATAFNIIYESSEPWGIHEKRPLTGITVRFNVWYRQVVGNPGVSG